MVDPIRRKLLRTGAAAAAISRASAIRPIGICEIISSRTSSTDRFAAVARALIISSIRTVFVDPGRILLTVIPNGATFFLEARELG